MTEQEIIEHTKQLVAIRSTADNKDGLCQSINYIAKLLAPYPEITVERFESNGIPSLLAYYGKNRPKRFDTIFNGHLDVVPAQNDNQYIPIVKDGRFYGRGVYDMKMATVALTDSLIQYGKNRGRAFGLQVVADEEVGGQNGILHQLAQGVAADFTIFGEMTDLGICNETRGVCWVEVGFTGTSAHGGYAWNGVNAVSKASDFATALLAKFPIPEAQQWCSTANIAAITTGNTTFNIVPDQATVKVDFRFTPEDPHFKNRQTLDKLIASIHPDAEIINIVTFEPAVHVPATNHHLRHFVATFENVTGNKATLIRRYASGDSRHLAKYDMPGIEFGLSGADLHGENEYVELASLAPLRDTLHAYMQSPIPSNPPGMQRQTKTVLTTA
jgi:succinyl-diaminopimelate desuccinylase